jgi:hypothetical protein
MSLVSTTLVGIAVAERVRHLCTGPTDTVALVRSPRGGVGFPIETRRHVFHATGPNGISRGDVRGGASRRRGRSRRPAAIRAWHSSTSIIGLVVLEERVVRGSQAS